MPRPDITRQTMATYPVSQEVQTRFQDLDVNMHLNNVAFAALFENARVLFNRSLRPWKDRPKNERSVVGQVTINYLREGRYPEPVIIGSGIGHIGNSSYNIAQGMFQKGECIATCDTIVVVKTDGLSKTLRPDIMSALQDMMLAKT